MKKSEAFLLVLVMSGLILANIVLAADDNAQKAYACLEGKVKGKCSSLSLEDQEFSLLALAYNADIQSECKSALMDKSKNKECWPESSCNLRQTAIADIALKYTGADAGLTDSWLLSQTMIPDELSWYLEIDTKDNSTCRISYDASNSTSTTIKINSDKTLSLSGSTGCLSLASPNYWLKISKSCLNKTIKVSCNKDFITALLYKKTDSDIWHVSSQTKSSSASGTTENFAAALCFKKSGKCDYEGSLWASLALSKSSDISAFLPYIIALASENEKYNPYAILYLLTTSDDYLANLRSAGKDANGLWTLSSSYGKYYDTALSLLSIQDLNDDQADAAKSYLLDNEGADGCWLSSRTLSDTAFLLYAGWPKSPVVNPTLSYCEDSGKYCSSRIECSDAGGIVSDNLACKDSFSICCSKQVLQKSCSQKNGVVCSSSQQCDGDEVSSSDETNCCLGECITAAESTCRQAGFNCRTSCLSEEESKPGFTCTGSQTCCSIIAQSSSLWWLWLLIILIIIIVLAIIFRNHLTLWFFQLRNKFKSGKVTQTRPPFFPPSQARPMMRPMPQALRPMQPVRRAISKTDKELEDTLKKLRDMSK